MNVPMLLLQREYAEIESRVSDLWRGTLSEMRLLRGQHVAAFENEIAAYTGAEYAIGVASGTDALTLALLAVGIRPGDEVLLQANAFTADVEAIRLAGGHPVLVDVDPETYGPDPRALRSAITARTRAVLMVHLYGAPLDLEPVSSLCREYGLRLVEDGSHAHGSRRGGRHVGTVGDAGAFSAGVMKNLGAYGDAGFVITNDAQVAQRIRLRQHHGQVGKNEHVCYGFNSRLDELQAAVLRAKLPLLESRNARRREFAAYYSQQLRDYCLAVPGMEQGAEHAFHQYVVQVENRGALRVALQEQGIETGLHYPVPLHRQPAWRSAYGDGLSFPNAEYLAGRILSLPIVPDLTWEEVTAVADRFRRCAEALQLWRVQSRLRAA